MAEEIITSNNAEDEMKTDTARSSAFRLLSSVALAGFLALGSGGVLGQGNSGKGGGGGGGSGGGGEAPDLGDLFVLYRNADGVPILTTDSCSSPSDYHPTPAL